MGHVSKVYLLIKYLNSEDIFLQGGKWYTQSAAFLLLPSEITTHVVVGTAPIYSLKSSGGHKSEMGFPGLKSGCGQGHLPSGGEGKKCFPASRGGPALLAPVQPPHHFLPHIFSDSDLLPSSFTSENSCGSTGPAWIIIDNLPSSLALKLNHICMVSLCQVRWHSQVLRIRMQMPLGAITQPQHAASSSTKNFKGLFHS